MVGFTWSLGRRYRSCSDYSRNTAQFEPRRYERVWLIVQLSKVHLIYALQLQVRYGVSRRNSLENPRDVPYANEHLYHNHNFRDTLQNERITAKATEKNVHP